MNSQTVILIELVDRKGKSMPRTLFVLLEQIFGPSRIEISQCSQLATKGSLVSLKIVPHWGLGIGIFGWQFGHSAATGDYSALVSGSACY